MSISEEVRSHGYVILKLWEGLSKEFPDTSFHLATGNSRSSYTITGLVCNTPGSKKRVGAGIFIKVSNMRVSPWRYSFTRDHQDEIQKLKDTDGEVFVAFVNGTDGIACLSYEGLKQILDENHDEQEWVAISRKIRQNYRVSGNDGEHEKPLPKNSFPGIVIDYFRDNLSC